MSEIRTRSTSRVTAEADPIVLREGERARLVFRPLLVDNAKSPEASVRGSFVYQRKGKEEVWEDWKEETLTTLKKGEGIELALHSGEVLGLFKGLSDLYAVHAAHGIPRGERTFVSAEDSLVALTRLSDDELAEVRALGTDALNRLLVWAVAEPNLPAVVQKLEALRPEVLSCLSLVAGVRLLKEAVALWESERENASEEFWHQTLLEHFHLLERVFPFPVLLVKDKAYVGGKTLENTGGKVVDFLIRNGLTHNAVLVEIKTPCTALLGSQYRSGVHAPGSEVAGAVVQVLEYRRLFVANVTDLTRESGVSVEGCDPPCVVIAGNASQELDSPDKRRSFELFRQQLASVDVLTFDELFEKARRWIDVSSGSNDEGTS